MFTVTANAESSGTMTVEYATADDSATAGDDYTRTSGTLTFSAGDRTATIEVAVIDDTNEEQDETFKVRLTNPAGATIEDDEGVGTIRDDDGTSPPPTTPSLRIGDATVHEGGGTAVFTVTANAESAGAMTVEYATADDSATAGDDYTSTSGTLTFSAGDRTATIEVTVIDDSDEEQDETFKVRLTNPAGATIEDDEGVGTIRDDDGTSPPPTTPSLRIGDATVHEGGGTAVFTVTANAESSGTMTVEYATADDSATAGDDYTSTSGTVTFSAGDRTATIEVTVIDDSDEEQDETFKVRLTNPAGATIERANGVGTIRDDDGTSPPPTTPSLRIGDATVHEGGGTAVFTVTANAESSGTMTVEYATADDSATAGDDYTRTSGTLTFSAGDRTANHRGSGDRRHQRGAGRDVQGAPHQSGRRHHRGRRGRRHHPR